jgi:hypothetical protein
MTYVAQEQICLNEARTKIVPCDSPEARSNLALPGAELDDAVAEKYGLIAPAAAGKSSTKEADGEEEKAQAAPPENKAKAGSAKK